MKKKHLIVLIGSVIVGAAIVFRATRLGNEDELSLAVVAALEGHPQIDASRLEVDVAHGVVTITGTLPHDAMRRIVIEEVEKVDGVDRVIDKMTVDEQTPEPPEVPQDNP